MSDKANQGVLSVDGTWTTAPAAAKVKAAADTAPVRRNALEARKPIDDLTGFDVGEDFQLFEQRDDIFNRVNWDDTVRSDKAVEFYAAYVMPNARVRKADGYTQRDYALRNAAWHFTKAFATLKVGEEGRNEGFNDTFTLHGPGWPERWDSEDPGGTSRDIKKIARLFGADDVGICAYDDRWVYSQKYNRIAEASVPVDIDDSLTHVIIVITAMDPDLTERVPSALAATATGMGYTHDAVTLMSLAQYIRNLGYQAHASMNDSALSIPLAVQAGLGEYGRHGLLINDKFGPRVRIGKIFTDIPLVPDEPKKFGVKEFCDVCNACAAACPPKAITFDEPSRDAPNRSSFDTIRKWTTDAEKCFKFWTTQNTECSICIRVCPYNRTFTRRRDRLWKWLAGGPLRRLALWIDGRTRDRSRQKSATWWST